MCVIGIRGYMVWGMKVAEGVCIIIRYKGVLGMGHGSGRGGVYHY